MRKVRFLWPVLAALVVAVGCGGGTSSSGSAGGGGGGGSIVPGQPNPYVPGSRPVLTDAEFKRITAAVGTARDKTLSADPGDNPDARFNELMAFKAESEKVPGVVTVDVDRTTLTGRVVLEDGLVIYAIHNRPAPDASAPASIPAPTAGRAAFPESRLAYVFNNLPAEPQPAQTAAALREAGYQVIEQPGTFDNVKAVRNAAFVLYNGHGTWGNRLAKMDPDVKSATFAPVEDGRSVWIMHTETPITAENFNQYRNDIYAGGTYLIMSETVFGSTHLSLGVGPETVRKNWSLDDGVVVINSCLSASKRYTKSGWSEAFEERGARAVFGWTSVCDTNSNRRSLSLVRMMLNVKDDYVPFNPLQRPMDVTEAFQEIVRRGLHRQPDNSGYMDLSGEVLTTTTFVMGTFGQHDVRLKPEIEGFEIKPEESGDDTLVIRGHFRPETPLVLVNDQPLTVKSSSDTKIEASIPDTGAASAGELIVRQYGRDSNKTYITQWKGTIKLKETWEFASEGGSGKFTYNGELPFTYRGDVMGTRPNPTANPVQNAFSSHQIKSQNGSYQLSGSAQSSEGVQLQVSGSGPVETMTAKAADAYAGLQSRGRANQDAFGFSRLRMQPDKSIEILSFLFAFGKMTTTANGVTSTSDTIFSMPGIGQDWTYGMEGTTVRLQSNMDAAYALKGAKSVCVILSEGVEIRKEVWFDTTPAQFAPPADAARGRN